MDLLTLTKVAVGVPEIRQTPYQGSGNCGCYVSKRGRGWPSALGPSAKSAQIRGLPLHRFRLEQEPTSNKGHQHYKECILHTVEMKIQAL